MSKKTPFIELGVIPFHWTCI